MKKILSLIMTIAMLFSVAAFAEESDPVIGDWYLAQVIIAGTAYSNVAEIGLDMVMTLNEDSTGVLTVNNESPSTCAWKPNPDGGYVFMEERTQQEIGLKLDDTTLILGNDNQNCYIFTREKNKPVDFAQVITAESKADFDGFYALTYVSGDGYTLPVEKAMSDLAAIGIKNTGIDIADGSVKMFGQDALEFAYSEDGTLYMDNADGLDLTNVKMYKLADGGLAINWLGLTFYAAPAQAPASPAEQTEEAPAEEVEETETLVEEVEDDEEV